MKIDVRKEGEAVIVKIVEKLDGSNAAEFEQRCSSIIDGGERHVILDLGSLDYISSAALRSVLILGKRLSGLGGKLLLYNLGGAVKEVFEISGFSAWCLNGDTWKKA